MVSPRSTRSPLVEIFNVNQPQPSLKIVRSYTGLSSTTSQATCFFPLALRGGQRLLPRMVLIFFTSKGPRLRSIRALKHLLHQRKRRTVATWTEASQSGILASSQDFCGEAGYGRLGRHLDNGQ